MYGDIDGPKKQFLDATDYAILVGMMLISVAIGIYFAYINKRKPNTTSEYLVGNKELPVFPIAMSLVSSIVSGFHFVAQPVEVYLYGSQLMVSPFFGMCALVVTLYCFIPVFCSLNVLSSYEYFTKRFNRNISILGSTLYFIKTLIHSAAVVYIPAIALSQLSGLKVEISIPILSITCIFYTAVGGLRAVVWADTFQTFFIIIGTFALIILGTYQVGGFKSLWERNANSGRIEFFNMNPDPTVRLTFWSVGVGTFFLVLSEAVGIQTVVQRALAVSTLKKIQKTVWLFTSVCCTIMLFSSFNGLVAFAALYDCDPITSKKVSRPDQLIPYLWMLLTQKIPALPGLFVSALFSASFSTISTNLNCMAGVFVISVVKPLCKRRITEAKATFYMKMMVLVFGCLVCILAFGIDTMGQIFQVLISFVSIINGPVLGLFVLGMFFPRVGTKAAVIGILVGFGLVTWMFIGAQVATSRNQIINPKKSFSVDGCDNSTLEQLQHESIQRKSNITTNGDEVFPLYAVSYFYYAFIASVTTVVVGWIISYFPGCKAENREDANLYSPIIRKFLRFKKSEEETVELKNVD